MQAKKTIWYWVKNLILVAAVLCVTFCAGYKYKGIRHPYRENDPAGAAYKTLYNESEKIRRFVDSTYYVYAHFNNSNIKKDSVQLRQLLISLKKSLDTINLEKRQRNTIVERMTYASGSRQYGTISIFLSPPNNTP